MGPLDRCQTCQAVVNPIWETCAACRRPITTQEIVIEPAAANPRPVYWERHGVLIGPAIPEFLARVGKGPKASYWIIAVYQESPIWINSMIVRSQQAFETQILPIVRDQIHKTASPMTRGGDVGNKNRKR